jgi:hypothetical protein
MATWDIFPSSSAHIQWSSVKQVEHVNSNFRRSCICITNICDTKECLDQVTNSTVVIFISCLLVRIPASSDSQRGSEISKRWRTNQAFYMVRSVFQQRWCKFIVTYRNVEYEPITRITPWMTKCRDLVKSQIHVTTDDQSASKSWIRAPSGSLDRTLISVWHLLFYRCRAPPLTRGRVCLLS